jgi:putative Mg2+ transporter-C (MgtC) family protein
MVNLPELSTQEMVLRIVLAGLFGAFVGFEREWRDRTAGLRTHMLVCIGAAAFTIISAYGFHDWWELFRVDGPRPNVIMDPGRIAAQVVSGIGFLGAGAIFQSRGSVKGLTTAGSLWAMAAIGMAVGTGMYEVATTCTVTIMVVLAVLRQTSRRIRRHHRHTRTDLTVHVVRDDAYPQMVDALQALDATITRLSGERVSKGSPDRRLYVEVDTPPGTEVPRVVGALLAVDGIESVSTEEDTD